MSSMVRGYNDVTATESSERSSLSSLLSASPITHHSNDDNDDDDNDDNNNNDKSYIAPLLELTFCRSSSRFNESNTCPSTMGAHISYTL